MTSQPDRVAFFDVDETLITVKSMFRFLEYHLVAGGRGMTEYQRISDGLQALSRSGISRADTNRLYYRAYAGQLVNELSHQGTDWFNAELSGGVLFRPEVVAELKRHQADGDLIVLVSGSFAPCLDPIAAHLDIHRVECTRPVIAAGRYTGVVETPIIGVGKADAVRRVIAETGADPQRCVAYGDHGSDLPMLLEVGERVAVGDDADLAAHATGPKWRRLDVAPVVVPPVAHPATR